MTRPHALSKSKLIAYRQCERRLWLEVFRPELRDDGSAVQAVFASGHQVGDVARSICDPKGVGATIYRDVLGFPGVFTETERLLKVRKPIFEASFAIPGAMVMADVLLPFGQKRAGTWRMVEVKSSAELKDVHRDDAAIQSYVTRKAGLALDAISVARIDTKWVYPGDGAYDGLLAEEDLTIDARSREAEVEDWIAKGHVLLGKKKEPRRPTGPHCNQPFTCGFFGYCSAANPVAKYPIEWLSRAQSKDLQKHIETKGIIDMRDVPDGLLNKQQLRVKRHTLTGKPLFEAEAAAEKLSAHKLPAIFLDFETVSFVVPIWAGTSPYQQIPFQFSAHRLSRTGQLTHRSFLDLSGEDPSRAFAKALLEICGERSPIFVYNATFEKGVITKLATRFPQMKLPLMALTERLVDLLPIARDHFYHPMQKGRWSIKSVLPAIAPDLDYAMLDGVKDGGMASAAYLEAIAFDTTDERRQAIEAELLRYCELDTFAMVRIWQQFSGSEIEIRT